MGYVEDLFNAAAIAIQKSFIRLVEDVAVLIPNLLAALILIVIGWGVAILSAWFVRKTLDSVKFEKYLKAHGLEDALGKVELTNVITLIFKYYIWLVFLREAISKLSLGTLTWFITDVLTAAPAFVGSLAVIVAGAILGEWVREKILETGKEPYLKTFGKVLKYFIIMLAVIVGLETMHFQIEIIKWVILVVLGSAAVGTGLAVGIAFGLAGQNTAKDMIESARSAFHI